MLQLIQLFHAWDFKILSRNARKGATTMHLNLPYNGDKKYHQKQQGQLLFKITLTPLALESFQIKKNGTSNRTLKNRRIVSV